MKKIWKRIIAMFLSVVLLLEMIPIVTKAEEENQPNLNKGNITVEGTNSFGNLLATQITALQEDNDGNYPRGYCIVDLTIEDNVATIEYDILEDAILIVALYTEDGIRLIMSGQSQVSFEENIATVTFEGEMPEYFLVESYLVDCYDFSPLCSAYKTVMYTREMQELLESTINDYDEEKVLNFDEDETTNFAVFTERVVVLNEVEGINTVASIDDENLIYVIENADESVTSLVEGEILAYSYTENEILIVCIHAVVFKL